MSVPPLAGHGECSLVAVVGSLSGNGDRGGGVRGGPAMVPPASTPFLYPLIAHSNTTNQDETHLFPQQALGLALTVPYLPDGRAEVSQSECSRVCHRHLLHEVSANLGDIQTARGACGTVWITEMPLA